MDDNQTPGAPAGTPPQPAPAQPTPSGAAPPAAGQAPATTVPPGQTLVSADELTRLRRDSDSYRGATPLINAVLQAGIKTPDELNSTLAPLYRARDQNIDIGAVLQSISPEQAAAEAQLTPDSIGHIVDERLGAFSQQQKIESATATHDSAKVAESGLTEKLITELAGGKDGWSPAASGIVNDLMKNNLLLYPVGHPLAQTRARPMTAAEFEEKIAGPARETWTGHMGQHLASIGEAAQNAAPPPPGGQGTADNANQEPTPFKHQPRQQRLEVARQLRTAREGGPMSGR